MSDKILFSNSVKEDIMQILKNGFQYKRILMLGDFLESDVDFFREYRYGYGIELLSSNDNIKVDLYDCVVIWNNLDLSLIDTCYQKEIPVIIVSNEYMSYEIVDKLLNLDENLLSIIINNDELTKNKSQCYCENLIDTLYHYMENFDYRLQKLLYETNYQYEKLDSQILNKHNFDDYNAQNMYDDMPTSTGFMDYLLQSNNKCNNFAYKLLYLQVQLKLYENFVKYVTPHNINMIEKFDFDENKFWFVLKHLKQNMMYDFYVLQGLVQEIKQKIITANIDYYYKLSNENSGFDIKSDLYCSIKNYNGKGFMKIIYQMGLLEY